MVTRPAWLSVGVGAGVLEQEGAGAVGALGVARVEARLAEERGLLVAEGAGDRDAVQGTAGLARTRPTTAGSPAASARGTPIAAHSSSSQSTVDRFISMVRLALVTSVMWRPVRFQISQVSMVPKRISPASARAPQPRLGVEQPADLRTGEVRGQRQPGALPETVLTLFAAQLGDELAVRVSCQTIALCTGWPVRRSHSTVVSRWLVIPMAARSLAPRPARCSALATHDWTLSQISAGSCSTQPGRGKYLPVLALVDGDDAAGDVEDDAARRCGALVDGGDEGHRASLGRMPVEVTEGLAAAAPEDFGDGAQQDLGVQPD